MNANDEVLLIADKKELSQVIHRLKQSSIHPVIEKRLAEFKAFESKTAKSWFSELCFCLLTANWKAHEAIMLQKKIGSNGFLTLTQAELQKILQKEGHRFHPQRAERIVLARKYSSSLKRNIMETDTHTARHFLVNTFKGIGFKEASHFLRNVGYFDVAIIDRHILRVMDRYKLYRHAQKTITPRYYQELEKRFCRFAESLAMSAGELDLYLWYLATGTVLK